MKKSKGLTRRGFIASALPVLAGCVGLEKKVNWRHMRPLDTFTKSGIHYYERGKGDVNIVFVHGYGGRAENFAAQINSLSKDYHVLALDLPGFGYSKKPNDKYTVEQSAEHLDDFLKEMNISESILVGQSRGCSVVRKYAAKNPKNVEAMVLCSAYIDGYTIVNKKLVEKIFETPVIGDILLPFAKLVLGRAQVRESLENSVHHDSRITDEIVEWCYEPIEKKDGFDAFVNAGRNLDLKITDEEDYKIDKAKIPSIFLSGKYDNVIPVVKKDYDRMIELENTGHLISIDQPELLTNYIRKAVKYRHLGLKEFVKEMKS